LAKEQYAQIGLTALRDPVTGDYLPAIPMYARVSDLGGAGPSGLPSAEEAALRDVGKIFASKMKKYIDGGGTIETGRRDVKRRRKNEAN
jgi:hypothetical protein